jgi:hypothetical protein
MNSHLDSHQYLTIHILISLKWWHHLQEDDKLWFPPTFHDTPSICREINNQSCLKAGYELVCDTKKKTKKYIKTALRCQCHRRAKESKATKSTTESTKTQDDTKPTCGVYVNVYKDINGGQFFFRRNGGHCFHHSGHRPLQKELKQGVKRHLPKSAVQDAHELIKRNVSKTIIQEMIEFKHDVKLKATTIQKMREVVLVEEFGIDKNNKKTTAQTLLNWLDAQPDVDYVVYLGSYEEAQNTVKVRKERKKGKRTRVVTKNPEDAAVVAAAGNSKIPPTQEMIPMTSSHTDSQTDNVVIPVPEKSNTALAEDPSIGTSLDETPLVCMSHSFSHVVSLS